MTRSQIELPTAATHTEHSGSNGIAIAPARSADGHALLLINPHTSFYNRSEQHVTSDQGLNVYGAATWGQFFIYQGLNAHAGWMHTSSGVDSVDEFLETIEGLAEKPTYRYGTERRPVSVVPITLRWRTDSGPMQSRTIVTFRTHHGPIVRAAPDGRWVAAALMNKPIPALTQSFLRTKQLDYESFLKIAQLQANSSNNTIFADASGNIAYLHPQFIPKRADRFDYRQPVDGADPQTDWHGLTDILEAPHLLNPPNGWIFNVNDWPWSAAGKYSPRRSEFPRYMDMTGPNPRTAHATLVVESEKTFTLESLAAAAYDSFLPGFARLIPQLVAAYDDLPGADPLKEKLQDPISVLRAWDYRWSADSVATSLAVNWGEALWAETSAAARRSDLPAMDYLATQTPADMKLRLLATSVDRLAERHGTWRTAWGDINRFQRPRDMENPRFNDSEPSVAVPFTSAQWGSLASIADRRSEGTKRGYGTSGNGFIAVVEFGEQVRAMAVMAGGASGDPTSAHFSDQVERFATGQLREVYFYPRQIEKHTARRYRP